MHEKLGEGGYGVVYRAEQRLLGREAVVKVLHARHGAEERIVQRFLREAQLASRLDHPYAAHIYAFGAEPDGLLWIAMERVRGTPLSEVLAAQPGRRMPLARLVPLLDRVCEVVHTAHEQGIVHRDLKPDNIMVLARAGRMLPKLLDFGVAKVIAEPREGAAGGAGGPDAGGRAGSDADAVPAPEPRVTGEPRVTSEPRATADLARTFDPRASAADVRLTQQGARVGSPFYMAPEQWVDGELDGRADLYALGIVAYEALVGRVPFPGPSLADIARGHARAELPPLPDDVPAAVGDVLRRATAKRRDDRFASALELAAALRAAAGLSLGADAVPRLDETVRAEAAWLPQPIAEAVAAFEGARNPHQARDALWQIVSVAARWLGVIALAARSRTGDRGGDGAAVTALLRELPRKELGDDEWLELVRALARPFAAIRDAHPVPELVELALAEPSPFAPLFALRAVEAATTTEESLRDRLVHALPLIADLLRALGALGGYQIVVRRGARAEIWMGKSRAPRPMIAAAPELAEGAPALADLDGRPVLALAPLCAIAEPAPGAALALFVFAGPGRARGRGARMVAEPHGFERHSDEVWAWLRAQVLGGDDAAAAPVEEAPYRGLAAFTEKDAALFFGRERAAEAFVNQLMVTPLLAVVGPSGAGKSSFVQAGVLPNLPTGWHAVILRPGAAPTAALAARLDQAGPPLPFDTRVIVVDQLEELFTLCLDPDERLRFAAALAAHAASPDDRVRVVVTVRDDFLARAGELPGLRERLAQGVTLLANPAPDDLLRIVVEPARRAGYDFDDDDLPARMVRAVAGRPGALALLSFTASRLWDLRDRHFKRLTRKAYDAIGGVEGALAAHAEETLTSSPADEQRLIREAFRHLVTAEGTRAVLTRKELGDVLGDTPHAGAVLERLIKARLLVATEGDDGADRVEVTHEALLSAWPRLVDWRRDDAEGARLRDQLRASARQWDERGRPRGMLWRDDALDDYRRWRARWPGALPELDQAFAAASLREAARGRRLRRTLAATAATVLVVGLVALALLYRSSARNARDAHDRVIAGYVEQGRRLLLDGDYLRALPYLSAAYSAGDDSVAVRFMLHRAMKLADMPTFPEHKAWAAAFRGKEEVLVVDEDGGAVVWNIPHHRVVSELPAPPTTSATTFPVATVARDGSFAAVGRSDGVVVWDGGHTQLLPVPGAVRVAFDQPARHLAIATARGIDVRDLRGGGDSWSMNLDGMPAQLYCLDHAVAVRLEDGHGYLVTPGRSIELGEVARLVPPVDKEFATISQSGVTIWSPAGDRLKTIVVSGVGSGALSPDGGRLAVSSSNGLITTYDTTTGVVLRSFSGHSGPARPSYSLDGSHLITSGEDHTLRIWDAESGTLLVQYASTGVTSSDVELDATGTRVLIAGPAGLRIFATRDPSVLRDLDLGEPVSTTTFSRSGSRILATADSSLQVFDAADGALLRRMDLRLADGAHLSPDETLAAVPMASAAKVEIREIRSGTLFATISAPTPVSWAAFDHSGTRIVTTGDGGAIDLWDLKGRHIGELKGHSGTVFSATFSSDDRRLASAGYDDRTARLWDLRTGRELARFVAPAGLYTVAADVRTTHLAIAGDDRMVYVFDGDDLTPEASLEHSSSVRASALSPDGTMAAGGARDSTITVWDLRSGQALARFHQGQQVMGVDFRPDGAALLSASLDNHVLVWDIGLDVPPPAAAGMFTRCHSPYELRDMTLQAASLLPCPVQP